MSKKSNKHNEYDEEYFFEDYLKEKNKKRQKDFYVKKKHRHTSYNDYDEEDGMYYNDDVENEDLYV